MTIKQGLLGLVPWFALVLLACPNPELRLKFREGQRLTDILRLKSEIGGIGLALHGMAFLQPGIDDYDLVLGIQVKHKLCKEHVAINPSAIEVWFEDLKLSGAPARYKPIDTSSRDETWLRFHFKGDLRAAKLLDSKGQQKKAGDVRIVLGDLVRFDSTTIVFDTVFAVERKLYHYWEVSVDEQSP